MKKEKILQEYIDLPIDELVKKLEEIVEQLENEETPIELAFHLFEEGSEISKILNKKINSFEKKLKILTPNDEIETVSPKHFE